ncbi:hypothetical protein AAFF_G00424270 [Aldrovandia affinis]|uniref:Uncharacterized protein n=1 Tax=Aldrovandia affinis TaxID=143900 RepID=A0AAD7T7Q6_9TELE|nr:hypothetical protein AAFF_G00424270 [Aldrovandia affinis]
MVTAGFSGVRVEAGAKWRLLGFLFVGVDPGVKPCPRGFWEFTREAQAAFSKVRQTAEKEILSSETEGDAAWIKLAETGRRERKKRGRFTGRQRLEEEEEEEEEEEGIVSKVRARGWEPRQPSRGPGEIVLPQPNKPAT